MDKPTPKERLEHILAAIESIRSFNAGIDEHTFLSDKLIQSAVLYQFMIIGEAIRYVDNIILDKYKYPWHIPRSFRNYIAHEYHRIKLERVFAASQELDELADMIAAILKNEF